MEIFLLIASSCLKSLIQSEYTPWDVRHARLLAHVNLGLSVPGVHANLHKRWCSFQDKNDSVAARLHQSLNGNKTWLSGGLKERKSTVTYSSPSVSLMYPASTSYSHSQSFPRCYSNCLKAHCRPRISYGYRKSISQVRSKASLLSFFSTTQILTLTEKVMLNYFTPPHLTTKVMNFSFKLLFFIYNNSSLSYIIRSDIKD